MLCTLVNHYGDLEAVAQARLFCGWKLYVDGVEEVHAEICYAECLLQRAVLNFINDENLIGFIKGSLKIKECYSSYK